MAFILFGYDQGVFGGIVTNANWMETFDHPDSGLEGIIVSIYNLGAFSGCIIGFFTGERLGRRLSMWFAMTWIVRWYCSIKTFWKLTFELLDCWRYLAGHGLQCPASDGWPLCYWHWHRTRDFYRYGRR